MDSKEPEIKKPDEIADAPLPEEALNEVVGGACCNGKHIINATITVAKAK
jgi:hypothetical protein